MEETGLIEQLSAGVVLSGGAVLMDGIGEAAEEILGMPVRVGSPVGVRGIVQLVQGPQWATGVGLVHHGAERLSQERHYADEAESRDFGSLESVASARESRGFGRGVIKWLRDAF